MPVEDFLALPGRFSSFSSNRRKREKTRGKRENPFRMKKRLPNLPSAVILSLLSYLAQSPTGRCQSGRMSTPGKCVYRKPVPRVRIPPCPPSIFYRNVFVMSILRFLFVGVWGRNGEKSVPRFLLLDSKNMRSRIGNHILLLLLGRVNIINTFEFHSKNIMSKDNSDFFEKKLLWSTVKDELLGCYLAPYLQKVICTHKPVYYIDCFAGKGRFNDGNPGSPLIALTTIDSCLQKTTIRSPEIESCYIDLNYAEDLKKNLTGYKKINIISGRYEEVIEELLSKKNGHNILYIDPYGIKALDCTLFDKLADLQFNSIELLINMNSFGFIREACRVLNVQYDDVESFSDIVEYEATILDRSKQSREDLTRIAGGDYWQEIVSEYKNGSIDGYEAEKRFSKEYCFRLRQKYQYVLNMPIRLKSGQHPKYRMIHATNHKDGCILMYENICSRWEKLGDIQAGCQMDLFEQNVENELIDEHFLKEQLLKNLSQYESPVSLNEMKADFLSTHGVICRPNTLIRMLKELEASESIKIIRDPAVTKTGIPSSFLTENSKQRVFLQRKI